VRCHANPDAGNGSCDGIRTMLRREIDISRYKI
jgi:hypothetical protein